MELMIIEMVAYETVHTTDCAPWRCVACERITQHTNADILPHLVRAHNYPGELLTKCHDSIFLNPPPKEGETHGKLHEELPQAGVTN